MLDNNELLTTVSDYDRGYQKGYKSRDHSWKDGIDEAFLKRKPESEEYKKGYAHGERDRIQDDTSARNKR